MGFALNIDNKRKFCRAMMKQVQQSDARMMVDRMHTRWRVALSQAQEDV
jgi:hypothetical protein